MKNGFYLFQSCRTCKTHILYVDQKTKIKKDLRKVAGPLDHNMSSECVAYLCEISRNKKLPEELHNLALIKYMQNPNDYFIGEYFKRFKNE